MAEKHPIRVVARRTGLSPDVLRAWERRYGAIQPGRDGTRRLYSDDDVERLVLLRRATLGGRSIGQVATLSTEELRRLVEEDDLAEETAPPGGRGRSGRIDPTPGPADRTAREHVEECMRAVRALDSAGLLAALSRARVALGDRVVAQEVIATVLEEVGDGWQEGKIRIAEEHLATAALRTFIGETTNRLGRMSNGARLVVTTPAGQAHEFGALIVATAAAAEGWAVTYLGPDLPADEIAAVAGRLEARAVALSIVHPPDDPRIGDELRQLREMLGDETAILVGGGASHGYRDDIAAADARHLTDMHTLRDHLAEIRARPAARGKDPK